MLKIAPKDLLAATTAELSAMQKTIDSLTAANYPAQVILANELWDKKTSTVKRKAAFQDIRTTLTKMCIGSVRCAYCEDSAADEIEHIYPKNLFPERAFSWDNYLFACGPCNGPKSNKFGTLKNSIISEFERKKGDPITPPPSGISGLIDPRAEDPTQLLHLDIGGTTPQGIQLQATFNFIARHGISTQEKARAEFTIITLGLNREVLRCARSNAFGGFRARLNEYSQRKQNGASQHELDQLRDDLLRTPHLTIFFEIIRQRQNLPPINQIITTSPEIINWQLY